MDSLFYEYKYLKYKIKYLKYKTMIGGELNCECIIKDGDKEIKGKKCSCSINEDPKLTPEGLKKFKKIKQQIEELEKKIKRYKHDKKVVMNTAKYKLPDFDDEDEDEQNRKGEMIKKKEEGDEIRKEDKEEIEKRKEERKKKEEERKKKKEEDEMKKKEDKEMKKG